MALYTLKSHCWHALGAIAWFPGKVYQSFWLHLQSLIVASGKATTLKAVVEVVVWVQW